jgi:hypothetical protein
MKKNVKIFPEITSILTVFIANNSVFSTFFQFLFVSKTSKNQSIQKKIKKKLQKDLEITKKAVPLRSQSETKGEEKKKVL